MALSTGFIVLMVILTIVQLVAIVYASYLIRRTKYNSIWILCIVGFAVSFAQHIIQIFSRRGYAIDSSLYLILDAVASLCVVLAVIFAHRLVNYIDRLTHQRTLFNKRIMTAVLRTEERSRSNFAKELHDGMGPLLSSARMSLSALPSDNLTEEQSEILKNTQYVIDEAIRSVREISNNMSPQILIDFGLAQGVKSFISRLNALNKVDIHFNTNLRKERFDSDVEVIMYRVICELINNSLKHSGCTSISLSLSFEADSLKLDYSDNGRGFRPKAVIDCGMGLSNIVSRIDSLNGEFDITSRKGQGMHAVARVSVSPNATENTTKHRAKSDRRG